MTVVVDLGCFNHPEHRGQSQDSAEVLVDRYRPRIYFGFDPHPGQGEGIDNVGANQETVRVWRSAAAWIYDGVTGFTADGLRSHTHATTRDKNLVPCFDVATWLRTLPVSVVLKCDIQTAEYEVLNRLIYSGTIARVDELLIEWHPIDGWETRRDAILERLTCPVREWSM